MSEESLVQERRRRVELLLRELGYEIVDAEELDDGYSASIQDSDGGFAAFYVDAETRFLEFNFIFSFSPEFQDFIRDRLDEMIQICYEFGAYTNIISSKEEIAFSVFTKVYYAGLNYSSLKETLADYKSAIHNLSDLLDIRQDQGEAYGDT